MFSKVPEKPFISTFHHMIRHPVIQERIESLGNKTLAVCNRRNIANAVRLIESASMPDLVVENIDIPRSCQD